MIIVSGRWIDFLIMNRKEKRTSTPWNRLLWGIEHYDRACSKESPKLIGGNWHPDNVPRYPGEPSRPVLFRTRVLARAWCKEKNDWYKSNDIKI